MKNLFKALSFAALVAFSASCTKDLCKDVDAGTQGTCEEGVVTCNSGYEKDSIGACNPEIRTKFFGTYAMTESAYDAGADTTYVANHSLTLATATSGILNMLATGFADAASSTVITASCNDTNWMTFTTAAASQISVGGSTFEVRNCTGTLTVTGSVSSLSLTYDLHSTTTGLKLYACTSTGVKQ